MFVRYHKWTVKLFLEGKGSRQGDSIECDKYVMKTAEFKELLYLKRCYQAYSSVYKKTLSAVETLSRKISNERESVTSFMSFSKSLDHIFIKTHFQ